MYKMLLLFFILTLLLGCKEDPSDKVAFDKGDTQTLSEQLVFISPNEEKLIYTGRWDQSNPVKPKVTWSGSSVIIRFKGANLIAKLENETGVDQFRVVINGKAKEKVFKVSTGINNYILAENLEDAEHTIILVKETLYNKATVFHGFYGDGHLLPPQPRPTLRLAFFGDSNMDGSSNYSEKNQGDSGSYYAYPAMVTRMLGAEMNLQALGGATLDNNDDNDVKSFIYSLDYHNQNINYRSGFKPDVIIVNAGANDLGAGKEVIKSRFTEVVKDLRNVYGEKPNIVLMNAYGWDVNEPANYTQALVEELGGKLSVLHFPWLWEQWHGSQWDHSGQAYMLAEHITSLDTNWQIEHDNDIVDGFGRHGDFSNGSFEFKAPFGGFGWRYIEDGVERIKNPEQAAEGQYYIRLIEGTEVHQPTDATADLKPGATIGNEVYTITAQIRAVGPQAKAKIITHFEGQQLYTHDDDPSTFQSTDFVLTPKWQTYQHEAKANEGVWTIFNYIKATQGTIEVDDVKMIFSRQIK